MLFKSLALSLLGKINPKIAKKLLIVGCILLLIYILIKAITEVYATGFEAGVSQEEKKYTQLLVEKEKEHARKLQKAIDLLNLNHLEELERVQKETKIDTVIEKVIEYVPEIEYVEGSCDTTIDDVIGVLDQTTNVIRSHSF